MVAMICLPNSFATLLLSTTSTSRCSMGSISIRMSPDSMVPADAGVVTFMPFDTSTQVLLYA